MIKIVLAHLKSIRRSLSLSLLTGVVFCLIGMMGCCTFARAMQPDGGSTGGWLPGAGLTWGGYLRGIGSVDFVNQDTLSHPADKSPYYDGQLELRLKNEIYSGSRWTLQTHYELVALGGDTYQSAQGGQNGSPAAPAGILSVPQTINDDRRLLNLTGQVSEEENYQIYHRLDRFNLIWTLDRGTLSLGRQALTWGDGIVFNPMDLFDPFAPASVQRDYKTGEDMVHLQIPLADSEVQLLFLPRRNPQSGDLQEDQSSYAMKYHTPVKTMEADLMIASHYNDYVMGMGASGYLQDAVWRINTTYTQPADGQSRDGFFQMVANIDYAWTWGGKNVYGLLEYYYNGLGLSGNYDGIVTDSDLADRLERGDLFTIGRNYLAGHVEIELHPLLHLDTTAVVNARDPSGVLQPQMLWDVSSDLQAIAGAQVYWGGNGTEYGGFDIPGPEGAVDVAPADRVYIWLTYNF